MVKLKNAQCQNRKRKGHLFTPDLQFETLFLSTETDGVTIQSGALVQIQNRTRQHTSLVSKQQDIVCAQRCYTCFTEEPTTSTLARTGAHSCVRCCMQTRRDQSRLRRATSQRRPDTHLRVACQPKLPKTMPLITICTSIKASADLIKAGNRWLCGPPIPL